MKARWTIKDVIYALVGLSFIFMFVAGIIGGYVAKKKLQARDDIGPTNYHLTLPPVPEYSIGPTKLADFTNRHRIRLSWPDQRTNVLKMMFQTNELVISVEQVQGGWFIRTTNQTEARKP